MTTGDGWRQCPSNSIVSISTFVTGLIVSNDGNSPDVLLRWVSVVRERTVVYMLQSRKVEDSGSSVRGHSSRIGIR